MQVLGVTNSLTKPCSFDPSHLYAYTTPSSPFPRIFCPSNHSISVQVIIFDRPSPTRMQYMSLEPISLALGNISSSSVVGTISQATEAYKDSKTRLIDKLRLHSVVENAPPQKEALSHILVQINSSLELRQLLLNNVSLIGPRQRRTLSVSERVVESATTIWDYAVFGIWQIITAWVYPLLTSAFIIGLICHRVVAEVILRVLDWRVRPESAALKDISATAQQVDIRLQQFCYWPIQYTTLRKRQDDWESVTDRHPEYIRFYNSLWLVANDVIIGIALGSYIIDNADFVAKQINAALTTWTVVGLQERIVWLTDWPAGLKLNTELANFLGDLFLWVIEYWSGTFA